MSVVNEVAEKVRSLPPEKQQEVLEFVDALHHQPVTQKPLFNPEGIWEGRGCDIPPEELAEARREMWDRFYAEDKA